MNPFDIDPRDFWRRHFEKQTGSLVAAVMRHCGVTQVKLTPRDMMLNGVEIEVTDTHEGKFIRIKDTFVLDDAAAVSDARPRSA